MKDSSLPGHPIPHQWSTAVRVVTGLVVGVGRPHPRLSWEVRITSSLEVLEQRPAQDHFQIVLGSSKSIFGDLHPTDIFVGE